MKATEDDATLDTIVAEVAQRREEFDRRFPGLLDSVIRTARNDPRLPRIDTQACFVPAGASPALKSAPTRVL